MKPFQLRAWIKKYGNAGTLLVACYLGLHHLWMKKRPLLFLVGGFFGFFLASVLWCCFHKRTEDKVPPALASPAISRPYETVHHSDSADNSLLQKAKPVLQLSAKLDSHLWLSNTKLLLVNRKQLHYINPDQWRGSAELFDLRTGISTPLKGLTRLLNRIEGTPWSFHQSPNGDWLEWITSDTGDHWPTTALAHLDGSNFQTIERGKFSSTYWLDNHRWAEQENRSDPILLLHVHDIAKKTEANIPLHSQQAQRLIRRRYNANQPFFDAQVENAATVSLYESTVSKYSHSEPEKTSTLHTVHFPEGSRVVDTCVSQEGKRVLYALLDGVVTEDSRPRKYTVWISHSDGSHLQELGCLSDTAERSNGSPDFWWSVGWLPNGKSFSFVYHNRLYIFPATSY